MSVGLTRSAKLILVNNQSPFDSNETAGAVFARIQTSARPKLCEAKAGGQDRRDHQNYSPRAHFRINSTIISRPRPANKKKLCSQELRPIAVVQTMPRHERQQARTHRWRSKLRA